MFVFCLLSFLQAGLFDSKFFDQVAESNGADCTKLNADQCPLVGSCVLKEGTCGTDPCFKRKVAVVGDCDTGCSEVANAGFCVSTSRLDSFSTTAQKCTLEWGEYETAEKGLCKTISGCGPVTAIEVTGNTFYVCGPGKEPRDPCSGLNEESCVYVGDCMLIDGACVTDGCFERTYTSADGCKNNTCTRAPPFATTPDLSYCKTTNKPLHHWCNVVSSSGTGASISVAAKLVPISGGSSTCTKRVTINNFDGDTLLIANNDADLTFTAVYPDAAASLNTFAVAIFAIIVLFVL